MLIKKIFGEKKSIQRELVKNTIIVIVVVLVCSLLFCYFAINYELNNKLHDIEALKEIEINQLTAISWRNVIIVIINIFLLSGILMKITTKKMLQPIQQITEATKEVASGNFEIELETKREDEIAELIKNFNKMVKELRSIDGIQRDFVDNVSHEVKTPISSIQGFAQLLQEDEISKEERIEYAGIIIEESNRLLNLSNNMLKLSRLQNKELITNKQRIDIEEQIKKAIFLLEKKWKEKNITFNLNLEKKEFYGDEELIFQVWVNLIENAIKFSNENGSIDISMQTHENKLRVIVKDYGIGINDKEKIFDRFYQEDESHSQTGSGLGLAIVKRIIELSEGEILVESENGKGATFTVILPLLEENNKIIIS